MAEYRELTNEGTISLALVEDGAEGSPKYTWIAYADDNQGTGISTSPANKKYLGIAHNKDTESDPDLTHHANLYAWSKIEGADGKGIQDTLVRYAIGQQTTHPADEDSSWKTSMSDVPYQKGNYLWTQVRFTYTDNTKKYSYSVTYIPLDGEDGEDGRSLISTTEYYQRTTTATAPSFTDATESNWSTTIQQVDKQHPYLWNAEKVTFTKAPLIERTAPALIARHTEDGEEGRGIASITNYYLTNNSETIPSPLPPGGNWKTSPSEVTMSSSTPYLWNCEIITYTKGIPLTVTTTPAIISRFSVQYYTYIRYSADTGSAPMHTTWQSGDIYIGTYTGTQSTAPSKNSFTWSLNKGEGISNIVNKYGNSNSASTQPTTWSDTPDPQPGKYLWTKTIITYDQGSSQDELITKTYVGKDGADGNGINSITNEFQITSTGTAPAKTDPNWQSQLINPTKEKKYLWRKETIDYTDKEDTVTVTLAAVYGDSGESAPETRAQYSGDGDSWHNTYDSGSDKYIHFSFDGGVTWGAAIKIVGESKDSFVIRLTPTNSLYKFVQNDKRVAYSPSEVYLSVFKKQNDLKEALFPPYGDSTGSTPKNRYTYDISIIKTIDQSEEQGLEEFYDHLPYLFNRLNGYVSNESGEQVIYPLYLTPDQKADPQVQYERDMEILSIDNQNHRVKFNIEKIFSCNILEDINPNRTNELKAINFLKKAIEEETVFFIFRVFLNDTHTTEEDLTPAPADSIGMTVASLEFGTSSVMAQFSVTAEKIQQAVNDAIMEFTGNGLTITNGEFNIKKVTQEEGEEPVEETVLSYTPQQGLSIVGNGSFTGEINATSGKFQGDVEASTLKVESGTIGGLIISEEKLTSDNGTDLIIDGKTGKIVTNNIELGTGAKIMQYISLGANGAAVIYNPDTNQHRFIEAGEFSLTDTGIMNIGQIELNSNESSISCGNALDNAYFRITPTTSRFNNIVAAGKITTAVFEMGKIQSVGGAMIFKPSYQAEVYEGNRRKLELDINFANTEKDVVEQGIISYVYLVDSEGKLSDNFYKITDVNNNIITLDTSIPENFQIKSIIDVGMPKRTGADGVEYPGSLLLGVNSTDAEGIILPRGFTVEEFITEDNTNINKIRTFLGDLSTLGINYLKGYGLYGDNVYLSGSLVTNIHGGNNVQTYAGINTLSSVPMNRNIKLLDGTDDTSNIVFWGGSNSLTDYDVQNAPFQVSEKGSLYASQARFTNSIISDAEIHGVDIYAARIHGEDSLHPGLPGTLSFYNATNGIIFYDREITYPETQKVFTIGTDGMSAGDIDQKPFIVVDKGDKFNLVTKASENKRLLTSAGEELIIRMRNSNARCSINIQNIDYLTAMSINTNGLYNEIASDTGYLELIGHRIRGRNGQTGSETNSGYLDLSYEEVALGLNGTDRNIVINNSQIDLTKDEIYVSNNFTVGGTLRYQKYIKSNTTMGYDLYLI